MPTQTQLASKARAHLEGNDPWEAAIVLEELVAAISKFPLESKESLILELAAVQLLAKQGLDLSGKWRERVVPSGSAYNATGSAAAECVTEYGGHLPSGLRA
jgi:hypothetical protein